MFTKKTASPQLEMPNTVIGKGILLEAAKMTGKESVRIDGSFRGNIDIEGSLVLGDTGHIDGDIKANYMVLAGSITGDIVSETILHLGSTARINGDVYAKSLIVDEGSRINGRFSVGDNPEGSRKSVEKVSEIAYVDSASEVRETQSDSSYSNRYDSDQSAD